MKYNLVFHFKEHGRYPEDRTQDEPMTLEQGFVVPDVGDEVTFRYEGRPTAFKVLSRSFSYSDHTCNIGIEVGNLKAEHPLGLKE